MRNVAILFLAVVFVGNAIADTHYTSTVPAVDATGQPVQLKSDASATKTVKPATAPAPVTEVAPKAPSVASKGLNSVFFDNNAADLTKEAKATLNEVAQYLKSNPNAKLTVEGHADKPGTAAHNMALSKRRAASVKGYLKAQGVQTARLQTKAVGAADPGTERKAALIVND